MKPFRTQNCTTAQARTRLAHAKKFLEVAKLTASEDPEDVEYASVTASLAVLAGIAASDAACCNALGFRCRSQDHRDAEKVLREIGPDGLAPAKALGRLLDVKDTAQYGLIHLGNKDLKNALRQADQLVTFAETLLRRG